MTHHLERNPLRIGITCGDLNGIGIEVVLKCFEDARMHTDITPILYANAHTVSHHRKALKLDEVQFQRVNDARDAVARKFNVVNVWEEDVAIEFGKPSG